MAPSWRTEESRRVFLAAPLCLLALAGCTGQNYEGAWRGPFPLPDAQDCRIRIAMSGNFDLSCRNESWMGVGKWRSTADGLHLEFVGLSRRGEPVRDPPPIELRTEPAGNRITVYAAGTPRNGYTWQRIPP